MSHHFEAGSVISESTLGGDPVSVNTPPASANLPVDLTAQFNDGAVITSPEGYSYGPTILEVVPNAATADGGQLGAVVGYGFGDSVSPLQVSIGGQTATIQNLYDYAPVSPYPFPVETLTFTIPPGIAGASTISITSPSGTTTGAFTYTSKAASYPVNASLQQGIYDPHRNLYFFSDRTKIQVFSPTSGTWQTPITLPGTTSGSQLLGISESPSGSLLAVSDYGGQAIYVLDPDIPATVNRYPMPIDYGAISLLAPSGLAVLDNGNVYFTTADIGGTGTPAFHELTTSTGQITNLGSAQSGGTSDMYDRVLLSPDQTKVYVNVEGATFWIDTATNAVNYAAGVASNDGGEIDGAVSADGSTIDFDGYITDALLNPETVPAYIDWETWLPTAVYGQKMNQDGSVLYQPLTNGIDLLERNTGRLLYRVQVPGTLANVYDSMFLGAPTGTLGYLTTSGITLVDLSSLSVPASAKTQFPASNLATKAINAAAERTASRPLQRARTGRPALTYARDATGKVRY